MHSRLARNRSLVLLHEQVMASSPTRYGMKMCIVFAGAVRLVASDCHTRGQSRTINEGRVEVYMNKTWGKCLWYLYPCPCMEIAPHVHEEVLMSMIPML